MVFYISLLFSLPFIQAKSGCKIHLANPNCTQNKKILDEYVIEKAAVFENAVLNCGVKCFIQDQCLSYNLGPVQGGIRSCELNAADHWMRPGTLVSKEGFEYCSIQNHCSSSPCPPDRLCTPDFAWDTYSCDDGAWTQWGPWSQCFHPKCPHVRKRNCSNPAPQKSGKTCPGADLETKKCNTPGPIKGCDSPLGMESRAIKNEQITASSYYHTSVYIPYQARLNNQQSSGSTGSWSSKFARVNEWLQVDLLRKINVTKVATQGRPAINQWVTEYSLSFSNDKIVWTKADGGKIYKGNSDQNTIVTNTLENPFEARYVRLIVKGFKWWPSMRIELYGCKC